MTRARASVAAAITVAIGVAALSRPLAQRGASQATSSLSGIVVVDEPQRLPLGGAIVTVSGVELPRPKSAITDVHGAFSVEGLPAGRYTVTASKAAYLGMAYGAKRPGRQGTELSLGAGQQVADLIVRLPRGAVLTGTLRDREGAPMAGVSVSAIRATAPGVRLASAEIPTAETDDRGVYRLFGLLPGDYLVAAADGTSTASGAMAIPSTEEIDRRFAQLQRRIVSPAISAAAPAVPAPPTQPLYGLTVIFYPGTPTATEAQRVSLVSGEERDASFVVGPVRSAALDGSVRATNGAPLPAVELSLDRIGPPLPFPFTSQPRLTVRPTVSDGRFSMTGVTPGQYLLSARSVTGPAAGGASNPMSWAFANVTSTGDDIAGLTLTLRPGLHVAGTVVFDPPRPPAPEVFAGVRISLSATNWAVSYGAGPTLRLTQPVVASVKTDGTFDVTDLLPGSYLISAAGSGSLWLRSAVIDGKDALDVPLELGAGDIRNAVLTFSERRAGVTGVVRTPNDTAAIDYAVVVFTTDRTMWRAGARRVKSARPANDGRFVVSDLPGGEYYVAALTDVGQEDLADPAFLAQVVPSALKLTLAEGEMRTNDLRILVTP